MNAIGTVHVLSEFLSAGTNHRKPVVFCSCQETLPGMANKNELTNNQGNKLAQ